MMKPAKLRLGTVEISDHVVGRYIDIFILRHVLLYVAKVFSYYTIIKSFLKVQNLKKVFVQKVLYDLYMVN